MFKMTFDSFNQGAPHPLTRLVREDLDLITELVLQSGSLKGLAKAYGVSYPTIRQRLDKVIDRLRDLVEGREPDPLAELLARLVERGELPASTAREVRDLARQMNTQGDA
jgi:hypothetical protein